MTSLSKFQGFLKSSQHLFSFYCYHFVEHCGAFVEATVDNRVIVQAVLFSFFSVFCFSMPSKLTIIVECSWV